MLATIALANSLSPAEFAAWVDGGWFDLRGGPELMIFSKILMDRWHDEDPEGLLAWAAKNKNGAAAHLMEDWATKQPQRLIDYFKIHPDDRTELQMLAKIAAVSPDLAIQRLKEITAAGIVGDARNYTAGLMAVLAGKSPTALSAILDSLPPLIKLQAEAAMSKLRLEASFSEEIRHLWDRPDGWKIFSDYLVGPDDIGTKLLGELANLPPEWRSGIALNPWRMVTESNAQQWWNADLGAAGFSAANIKEIHTEAVKNMVITNPEAVIQRLGDLNADPDDRKNILNRLFNGAADPEKARTWIAQLPTEEERLTATRILDQRTIPMEVTKITSPDDMLSKIGEGAHLYGGSGYFSQMKDWDDEKTTALAAGFKILPDEQKQQIAQVVFAQLQMNGAPAGLRDEAIRYLASKPPVSESNGHEVWNSVPAKISQYAVNFSAKDPEAASEWVNSLPAGEIKSWTQKNLINNWRQYDPKAADLWEKSLPATDRAALEMLGTTPVR